MLLLVAFFFFFSSSSFVRFITPHVFIFSPLFFFLAFRGDFVVARLMHSHVIFFLLSSAVVFLNFLLICHHFIVSHLIDAHVCACILLKKKKAIVCVCLCVIRSTAPTPPFFLLLFLVLLLCTL